jgi:autotransporter-associated beta strand protein
MNKASSIRYFGSLSLAVAWLCLNGLVPSSSFAATSTWDGNTDPNNDGTWSTVANWDAGGVPNAVDAIAVLPDVTGNGSSGTTTRTVTADVAVSLEQLTMNRNNGYLNLLRLNADMAVGKMVSDGTAHHSYTRIDVNGHTFTVGVGNLDTAYGQLAPFAGTGTVVKTGTGTVYVVGETTSSFTGTYKVENGVLIGQYARVSNSSTIQVDSGATYYMLASGGEAPKITLNGTGFAGQGGALRIGDNYAYGGALTLATDAWVAVNASRTLTLNSALVGPGGLTKTGDGRFLINSDSNSYTAGTAINAGIFEVAGLFQNSVITVNTGGTLTAPAYRVGTVILNGGTWNNTALPEWIKGTAFSGNDDGAWSETASWGTGAVPTTQAILGTVTGNGSSGTSTRTITVGAPGSVGTLSMVQGNGSYINKLLVNENFAIGTLTMNPANEWGRYRIEVADGKTLQVGAAADGLPHLAGSGTIEKIGTGTAKLIYSSEHTFPGTYRASGGVTYLNYSRIRGLDYVVDGGTLQIDSTSYVYSGTDMTLSGSGHAGAGALLFNAVPGAWAPSSITLAGPATLAVANAITVTLNTGIGGDGRLVKSGAGTLVLGGVNTFTGGARVDQGTLRLSGEMRTGRTEIGGSGRIEGGSGVFHFNPHSDLITVEAGGVLDITNLTLDLLGGAGQSFVIVDYSAGGTILGTEFFAVYGLLPGFQYLDYGSPTDPFIRSIPEPMAGGLFLLGTALLAMRRRRASPLHRG